MRVGIHRCIHCGIMYSYQASGSHWSLSTPEQFNDKEYCPDCKEAILEALYKIPVKRKQEFVETDIVSFKTLKEWENELAEEDLQELHSSDPPLLPRGRQVFACLYNVDRMEHQVHERVDGRHEHRGKVFHYVYWPSMIEDVKVLVSSERNLETGEIVGFW